MSRRQSRKCKVGWVICSIGGISQLSVRKETLMDSILGTQVNLGLNVLSNGQSHLAGSWESAKLWQGVTWGWKMS